MQKIKFFLVCDEPPSIRNSDKHKLLSSVASVEENVFFLGSDVEFTCNDGHVSVNHVTHCDMNGTWSPVGDCYPGFMRL